MSDIVFMDTETLGLDKRAPIWEFAAVRINSDGTKEKYHAFLDHSPYKGWGGKGMWTDDLPKGFRLDYQLRYDHRDAIRCGDLVDMLAHIYRGRAHTVGAVPSFDTERLSRLCQKYGKPDPWHYHLIDIENVIIGYLVGIGKQEANYGDLNELDMSRVMPPWKSDELSRAVDVEPDQFDRHTAMGDVRWVMAQWDAVMGGAR